jgi:hypothetical protein
MEPGRMAFFTVSPGPNVTVLYLSVSVESHYDFVSLGSDLFFFSEPESRSYC